MRKLIAGASRQDQEPVVAIFSWKRAESPLHLVYGATEDTRSPINLLSQGSPLSTLAIKSTQNRGRQHLGNGGGARAALKRILACIELVCKSLRKWSRERSSEREVCPSE